jgi:hypothetical protein
VGIPPGDFAELARVLRGEIPEGVSVALILGQQHASREDREIRDDDDERVEAGRDERREPGGEP